MVNIFREVDEDIRKERYISLFRNYGVYVIGFITLIIIILSSIQFYSSYKISSNEKIIEEYIDIIEMDENRVDDILISLANLDLSSNFFLNGMKFLDQSDLNLKNTNKLKATEILNIIIEGKSFFQIHRELAVYKIVMLNLDTMSSEEIKNLKRHIEDESEFNSLIDELLGIKLLIEGNINESNSAFNNLILDPKVPNNIKNRAKIFINIQR